MTFSKKFVECFGIDPNKTNFATLFLLALGIIDSRQNMTHDEAIRLILNKAANNLADAGETWGTLSAYERNWFVARTRQTDCATMAAFLGGQPPRWRQGGTQWAAKIHQSQAAINRQQPALAQAFERKNQRSPDKRPIAN